MAIIRKSDPVRRAHIWLGLLVCVLTVSCVKDFDFEISRAERHFYQNEAGFDALGEALLAHPEIQEVAWTKDQPCTIGSWTEPERPCNDVELRIHEALIGLNFRQATQIFFRRSNTGRAYIPNVGIGQWTAGQNERQFSKSVRLEYIFSEEMFSHDADCREKALEQNEIDCIQRLSDSWGLLFLGFSFGMNTETLEELDVPGQVEWYEDDLVD